MPGGVVPHVRDVREDLVRRRAIVMFLSTLTLAPFLRHEA
jgi:hypothetical protein